MRYQLGFLALKHYDGEKGDGWNRTEETHSVARSMWTPSSDEISDLMLALNTHVTAKSPPSLSKHISTDWFCRISVVMFMLTDVVRRLHRLRASVLEAAKKSCARPSQPYARTVLPVCGTPRLVRCARPSQQNARITLPDCGTP